METLVKMFVVILVCLTQTISASEKWDLVDSKLGITVFERWVHVTNNLTVRERKGEMVVKSSVGTVVQTLSDPQKVKYWMRNVSNAYVVQKISNNSWYTYTLFSLPWPLENKDMVTFSSLKYKENAEGVIIEIQSRENVVPQKDNVQRLTNYKAIWDIVAKGNGYVSISLTAISMTPPEYPRFIQDPILKRAFMQNLNNLQNILNK